MKRVFKNPVVTFILGALIFSSISVYAAHKYAASNITYKDTTLDQALDTLYTTQNTTVSSQTTQINSLQQQVTELTAASSEKDYVTGTFTFPSSGNKDCNLGFRPSKLVVYYISGSRGCIVSYNGGSKYSVAIADGDAGWVSTNGDWYFAITQSGFKVVDLPNWESVVNKTFTYIAFK